MKIYRLKLEIQPSDFYFTRSVLDSKDKLAFIYGKKIDSINEDNIEAENIKEEKADLIGTGDSVYLVSEKLKNILKSHSSKQEIHFLSQEIYGDQYYLLNLIGLRECMDLKNATFSTFENGMPDEITTLVVLDDKIETHDIFRIKEKPLHIFVTQKLKEVLEKNECTGIFFLENMNLTFG